MKLRKDKWEKVKIGDIASIQYGSSKQMQIGEDGFKTFRMNKITNGVAFDSGEMKKTLLSEKDFQAYFLQKGDILFNRTNSYELVGRTGIFNLDGEYMFASYLLRLKINPQKADSFFITHLMTSLVFQKQLKTIASKAVGQANINPTNLKKQILPLPPLDEQKQIAALFQSIESAMEQVDGQEKTLLNLKNKLLKDLFNDKKEFGNHLKAKDFETVKFERVAINISERVEPKKTELIVYVGLEHLDADNLKIERTGTPDDVIGTKLKIYKGDIIFGKRRAYLRKVAFSHFDGIASAHSMILRANEKNIEKDFLPYFMQSDAFMSRAVQISEGSLSPTIKNKTLAVQEFILPKKEKQKELVSVFKQFDSTMEQLKQQKTTLKNLKQKLLNEILG